MTYNGLWRQLAQIYDEGEAKAIARMVYEVRYDLTLSDIYLGKDAQLSADCQTELKEIVKRLLQGEPIQYVLGQADFCGRQFMVNEHVLIPRPETEELCHWIILRNGLQDYRTITTKEKSVQSKSLSPVVRCKKILDVGTGSGCIAITLAAEMPQAEVTAWDISAEALKVAAENARRHNVSVSFEQVDVLNVQCSMFLATPHSQRENVQWDIIVSNPPYICHKECEAMENNVLEHEPHTALFVPDDDPLLFYRAIAQYGQSALKDDGWLYFEINPIYAEALCDMLSKMSYRDIEIKEDQYGKQRMIRAKRCASEQ